MALARHMQELEDDLPKALVADPLRVVLDVDKVDMAPQILTTGALLQVNTFLYQA